MVRCGLRIPGEVHAELLAAAKRNGRPLNTELASRLIWSLYRGSILKELLEAARGGTLADFAIQAEEEIKENERSSPLREAAIALSDEVDRMWNDVHRFNPQSWESHAKAISEAQQELAAVIGKATTP